MTKQEREELFIRLVLWSNEREVYRKYGHLSADEMPAEVGQWTNELLCRSFVRLTDAGMLDEDLPMPYEHLKDGVDVVSDLLRYEWQDGWSFPKYHFDFAVLRGGRVVCYDAVPWWEAVERLYEDKRLGGWPMDDEPMAVRFCVSDEWHEVHTRRELPSLLDAFKAEVARCFADFGEGTEDEEWTAREFPHLKFPMFMQVFFDAPILGGVKVSIRSGEGSDGSGADWYLMECLPLTDARKGVMASGADRDIRSLIRR